MEGAMEGEEWLPLSMKSVVRYGLWTMCSSLSTIRSLYGLVLVQLSPLNAVLTLRENSKWQR